MLTLWLNYYVNKSFRVEAKSIISLLSNGVLEDAIANLSYHKNTEESVREEKAREEEETKYDVEDEDVNNFKSDYDYSYAPKI